VQSSSATRLSQAHPSWWQRLWTKFGPKLAPAWGIASFLLILILVASNLLLWHRVTQLDSALHSSGMRAIPLVSTGLVSNAAGFVIIGADGKNGAFVVDALPPLEADQQYQLWLIHHEEINSGAVFSVDENGYGGGRIRAPRNLLEYSGCDISIEPAGGSAWPTGYKVLAGALD
jgi:anti-sigma-K factor RskA